MNKIIYYVAVSLDGFIAGQNDGISLFAPYKPLVNYYLEDLRNFRTVIMGRRTYEFGYNFGLEPGQPAYPLMEHYIFSDSLKFENTHPKVLIEKLASQARIREIRDRATGNVYLCGGGAFAGWMLDNDLIDSIKLKVNPILLGDGIRLFGKSSKAMKLEEVECLDFGEGYRMVTYDILN